MLHNSPTAFLGLKIGATPHYPPKLLTNWTLVFVQSHVVGFYAHKTSGLEKTTRNWQPLHIHGRAPEPM